MNKIKIIIKGLMIVVLFAIQSCGEDFLTPEPVIQQSPETIKTVADLEMVMLGAYDLMSSKSYYNSTIITRNDVRGDDMQTVEKGRLDDEYRYRYTASNDFSNSTWYKPFEVLRAANNVLSIADNIEVPAADTDRLNSVKGQAYTVRALAHFDLCRMFARQYSHDNGASPGIPIVTEIIVPEAEMSRNTVAEAYAQIIADLNNAITLLPVSTELGEHGEVNNWAAQTLLARVYLYMEDNANAYQVADYIIKNSPYSLIPRDEYVDSWGKESTSESIFSIINTSTDDGGSTGVGALSDPEGYGQFVATQDFIDLMATYPNDIRRELLYKNQYSTDDTSTWGRVLKYPGEGNTRADIVSGIFLTNTSQTNDVPVFRLSEVYLIAAEAAIKESDVTNARIYLNAIVERADPAATVDLVNVNLDRILLERRKEFVAEGHRFFDLIRNKKDIVRKECDRVWDITTPLEIKYDYYKTIFPIPIDEIQVNSNIEQNPGY